TSYFDSESNEIDDSLSSNPLVAIFNEITTKLPFHQKLKTEIPKLSRTYRDMMEGKKAYSEVLYYRIQKKLKGTGGTLQNFWLENTPGVDIMQYIDTQVKYGVDYDYRIYAYTFVVGNKYRYTKN
ncbi:MAG TPA: hypothetical protein DCM40_17885, partial [Maribacter sp.]|nr:hypothetical protein [Maribacter sp.]